jgi:peptidyl-dipeptidase A
MERTLMLALVPLVILGCHGSKPKAPATLPASAPVVVDPNSEEALRTWLTAKEAQVRPLAIASAEAQWKADGSGKDEDYAAAEAANLALKKAFASRDDFAYLKGVKAAGLIKDPLLVRQLDVLYLAFLGNQYDPALLEKIVKAETDLGKKYNTYRAKVDGKELTDNEVEDVLKNSKDLKLRKKVWEASKAIGADVAADVIALVKLRNQAAVELGYKNFYELSLALGELSEPRLFGIMDDLVTRTDDLFKDVKAPIDAALAKRYGIKVKDLRPWHYEDRFFQEAPAAGSVNLDPYYKGKDPVALATTYYDGIGLPLGDLVARSDLKGRPGKYQHAYCSDFDRAGDVRVMESVQDDEKWMDTTLHEFGHAVYAMSTDKHPEIPYFLRDAAHSFTTEAFAILMGNMATNPAWMKQLAGLSDADAKKLEPQLRTRFRTGQLVFARWAMVMVYFERQLYENPDQDLNALWWQLVNRYQMINLPENRNAPDWAAKIHLALYPVYYQNYMLGYLYGAQLHDAAVKKFYPGESPRSVTYAGNPEVGKWYADSIFGLGMTVPWEQFVEKTTGEPLSARAYADALAALAAK